jgi:hypothetical protein
LLTELDEELLQWVAHVRKRQAIRIPRSAINQNLKEKGIYYVPEQDG